MLWVRRLLGYFLSLVLFLMVIGGVVAYSLNTNLSQPEKLEAWLAQSSYYDHFVTDIASQSQKAIAVNDQLGAVELSDKLVRQAITASFPKDAIQGDINTIITSHYGWLQGKTPTPNFRIDFTQNRIMFAQQISTSVKKHLDQAPECTANQISSLQNLDLLTIPCRPSGLNADVEASQIQQATIDSHDFLSQPIITADNIGKNLTNKSSSRSSQPYYQKLAMLPRYYHLTIKAPAIFGALTIASLAGIMLVTTKKRQGIRHITKMLLLAGIALLALKITADILLKKALERGFRHINDTAIQQTVSNVSHRAEAAITHIDVMFGLALIAASLLVFAILLATHRLIRPRQPRHEQTEQASVLPVSSIEEQVANTTVTPKRKKRRRPKTNKAILDGFSSTSAASVIKPAPATKKLTPVMDMLPQRKQKPEATTEVIEQVFEPKPEQSAPATVTKPKLGRRNIIQ